MDALDLSSNQWVTAYFEDVTHGVDSLPMHLFATRPRHSPRPLLTFDALRRDTPLVDDLRELLQSLESAYGVPVDVEFSVNFTPTGRYRINPLQCRPFQIRNEEVREKMPGPAHARTVLDSKGPMIGMGLTSPVDRFVWVDPEAYSLLTERKQHSVASAIGRMNRLTPPEKKVLLIGPGRWGTREPSLGVPVRFGEISNAIAVVELQAMHGHLLPDASLGTHFLNELIECDILYAHVDPNAPETRLDVTALLESPNQLEKLMPEAETWLQEVVKIIDPQHLHLEANGLEQYVRILHDDNRS
jgi:hypothetical protein